MARCTKIIEPDTEDAKYVINVKQIAKFVVALGDRVAPTDIEEGMRVGVDRNKYQIQIPLPPKIDPTVTMMTVEEKPDITYGDIGGCKEQIEKMREVVELPMLHPEKFVKLGIDPPKGVLCYGPPGTGKTLLARAVANRTDACFIRVIGSELVQKYVGEGARMVRELFQMARSKKACLIFFDEVDAIAGARFDDGAGGDNEVQRTMLEIVNQLDGFDARGNIKVLMATNRPDTLDPALLRPQGTAASRSSISAGPSAGSSGSVSRAGRGSAPSHQPPGPWGDHQRSWGFGIGPEGSVGLEWARGGGGGRTRV